MAYLTTKELVAAMLANFNVKWKGVYRVSLENTALSPSPAVSETWFRVSFIFGASNKHSIDGDNSIERAYGIFRVEASIPLNSSISVLSDLVDLVAKTFSPTYWSVPHLHIYPTTLVDKTTSSTHFVGMIDTPFHYNKNSGEVNVSVVTPSLKAALQAANSPLLL